MSTFGLAILSMEAHKKQYENSGPGLLPVLISTCTHMELSACMNDSGQPGTL